VGGFRKTQRAYGEEISWGRVVGKLTKAYLLSTGMEAF
jgi:hypothetical protein